MTEKQEKLGGISELGSRNSGAANQTLGKGISALNSKDMVARLRTPNVSLKNSITSTT